ncbi:MAG: hypothetical protein WCG67_06460, partial [Ferruginibacter sp.]
MNEYSGNGTTTKKVNQTIKMRFTFLFIFLSHFVFAQFAPPAGQAGTTAMYKDSSDFIAWASFCVLQRGLQDISNVSGGYAAIGDSSKSIG